ncbi:MAG: hypothetical protein GC180_05715 [Bacteroidetes bacterium]|nr:hypothetical protein [Bacteroidota bacterium]
MNSNSFIIAFVLIPLLSFVLSLVLPARKENLIWKFSFASVLIQGIALVSFTFYWGGNGFVPMNFSEWTLYQSTEYKFVIDFYFDAITVVYLLVGAMVSLLVIKFSGYYLHREAGFKRFFNTILFFELAYQFTVLSGNFETLIMGWEMLGISSFILIAFYRDRYLPVRNSIKVFSIYRIGDIGLILALWGMHHLWHQNVFFLELRGFGEVEHHIANQPAFSYFVALSILMAASAKSAILPFSSWLPRAMEGPTSSSAIFYGALSVHFGIFLLLRTSIFWFHLDGIRWLLAALGTASAAIAFLISRVQFTIKAKVAYASITQIGIMCVELALGWNTLVLIHFVGNAFLRTYQLLVSPSIVNYMVRQQTYSEGKATRPSFFNYGHLANSFYLLALKEWNLDAFFNRLIFRNVKQFGKRLDFFTPFNVVFILLPFYLIALLLYYYRATLPDTLVSWMPEILGVVALLMVFKAFSERIYPRLAFGMVLLAHFWTYLSISFNHELSALQMQFYFGGVLFGGAIGLLVLNRLRMKERAFFDLNNYYGHVDEYPGLARWYLISVLCVMGFPITSTFIGEDLLFSNIYRNQFVLAVIHSLIYIFGGIALIRSFARLFWGPNLKPYFSKALKSA